MKYVAFALMGLAPVVAAETLTEASFAQLGSAQIVILGEVHDSLAHHLVQAEIIAQLRPTSIVYEMLTAQQAALVNVDLIQDQKGLERALGWDASGWPDFSMYYPIFLASGDAHVYGAAVPRAVAKTAMTDGLSAAFGEDAFRFGLEKALSADQHLERMSLQKVAHCDALPESLLPGMVAIQRLRDARLAQVALQALDEEGGRVVVIAGNGHARVDWGAPAAIGLAQSDVVVLSVGQGEGGHAPQGKFDLILMSRAVERDDPCKAFVKN